MIHHLVFDGVADGPLGIGLEVVAATARVVRLGPTPRQQVVSLDGAPVRTATGRTLGVDAALDLESLGPGDVIVLPGLGLPTVPEITAGLARPDIVRGAALLPRAADAGALVAASCSATFVLAAGGLLDGRTATTTWWLAPFFAKRFPKVRLTPDRMVVDSGTALTAGAAFAHADLLLAVIARTVSPSTAHLVARYLVLDERPSQAGYMVLGHLAAADPVLRKLESFVLANLGRQLSLDELAKATATSPRTLARRTEEGLGMSPLRLVQRLRVARALALLDSTREPVEEIAARVGYADAAAFRRVFRAETGSSPSGRRRG